MNRTEAKKLDPGNWVLVDDTPTSVYSRTLEWVEVIDSKVVDVEVRSPPGWSRGTRKAGAIRVRRDPVYMKRWTSARPALLSGAATDRGGGALPVGDDVGVALALIRNVDFHGRFENREALDLAMEERRKAGAKRASDRAADDDLFELLVARVGALFGDSKARCYFARSTRTVEVRTSDVATAGLLLSHAPAGGHPRVEIELKLEDLKAALDGVRSQVDGEAEADI